MDKEESGQTGRQSRVSEAPLLDGLEGISPLVLCADDVSTGRLGECELMTESLVWIDVANSPQVLFFHPVIEELRRRGVPVYCTSRDFAQTRDLCELLGIQTHQIGRHGGVSLWGKGYTLVERVAHLREVGRKLRPGVAVSHNSYAQVLAARTLRVPSVTAMDYEFQPANHLAFRCADLVVVPSAFPIDRLRSQGATPKRTWRYRGLKEDISLAGFTRTAGYLESAGIDNGRPVVVVRPPATMALYHRFGNPLFRGLLDRLAREDATTVLLSRTEAQAEELGAAGFGDLIWRGPVLDGRQLIAAADVVVSAGGSMNREAAVLGTPAYSAYAGRLSAVDRLLVAQNRLVLLRDAEDVAAMRLVRKLVEPRRAIESVLLLEFVDHILSSRCR
jgi:hypothetical protein